MRNTSEQPLKPFVKWVGGKRQLMTAIKEHLPAQATKKHVEPFVGGGAVFLNLKPENLHINDLNSELITTYQVVKDELDTLLEKLEEFSHKNNKKDYLEIRGWDSSGYLSVASSVERAARMIYLNKTGFNGLYRVNRKGFSNVAFADNKNALIKDEENLRRMNTYLNTIEAKITQGSYRDVLSTCEEGDFVYLDPPYASETDGFVSYTGDGFTNGDQEELRDMLVDLDKRGCYWLYSNASTPLIHDLFKEYKDTTSIVYASRTVNASGSGRGRVPEVLISNYVEVQRTKTLFDL